MSSEVKTSSIPPSIFRINAVTSKCDECQFLRSGAFTASRCSVEDRLLGESVFRSCENLMWFRRKKDN